MWLSEWFLCFYDNLTHGEHDMNKKDILCIFFKKKKPADPKYSNLSTHFPVFPDSYKPS